MSSVHFSHLSVHFFLILDAFVFLPCGLSDKNHNSFDLCVYILYAFFYYFVFKLYFYLVLITWFYSFLYCPNILSWLVSITKGCRKKVSIAVLLWCNWTAILILFLFISLLPAFLFRMMVWVIFLIHYFLHTPLPEWSMLPYSIELSHVFLYSLYVYHAWTH